MTEQIPQEGGTYERQPDGSLKRVPDAPTEPAKKKPAVQE